MQLGRIAVHAKRAGARQLVLAVAATQQSDAKHPRSARSEKIPDRIADNIAFVDRDAEALLAIEKEIGSGLRVKNVAALDDDRLRANAEDFQRAIDLRPTARRGDSVRHFRGAEGAQKLDCARKRPALRQKVTKKFAVTALQLLGLLGGEIAAKLASNRPGKQAAAHADPAVNPPAIDRQLRLRQRPLPREHVGVNGVDKRAIQIENQSGHNGLRISSYSPSMENASQSPRLADLIEILYRPRETMRRILESGDRWVVQVTMLAAVCTDTQDIDASRVSELLPQVKMMPMLAAVALGLIVDALSWVLLLYILSWIAFAIGRFLGGTAPVRDLRAAMAWALVPAIFSPLYRIPSVIAAHSLHVVGPRTNVHATVLNFLSHGGCSLIVIYLFVQILFELAVVVLASFTVAEAQRFSTQKGFVNVIATLALPVAVVLAAVFTFRS